MKEILEHTGYSYSGISDLLRESPEKAKQFLKSVDNEYRATKNIIKQKKKELEMLQRKNDLLVSCFIHAHTVFMRDGKIKDKEPLTFLNKLNIVVIHRIAEDRIDYESIPLTEINK